MLFKKLQTSEELKNLVRSKEIELPIEQSPAWRKFDLTRGRKHHGWILYQPGGEPRAILALVEFNIHGFSYLWSKHAPVWLGDAPDEEQEAEFFRSFRSFVRKEFPKVVFARISAWHRSPDLKPLLNALTYDQTVIVDLQMSEEEILAGMSQTGRYEVRKGAKNPDLKIIERTGDAAAFDKCYQIYQETASRSGFGIHPKEVYADMLESLGPKHCRLFVAEHGGEPVAWAIVTVYDRHGVYYYAGSNRQAMKLLAPIQLQWKIIQQLKSEGVKEYDLMGIASDLSPQLSGVSRFKLKFTREATTIPADWELPVRKFTFAALQLAKKVKKALKK